MNIGDQRAAGKGDGFMKWTRVRTWAGMHPVWAVNLVTAFSLLCCVLLFFVIVSAAGGRRITSETAEAFLIFGTLSFLFLAGTTSAAFISLLLARAGLRSRRVLLAASWVPLFAASGWAVLLTVVSLVTIVVTGKLPGGINWPAVFLGWVVVSVTLAAGYLVGWMIAALFVRYKRRKGHGETTKPVELN